MCLRGAFKKKMKGLRTSSWVRREQTGDCRHTGAPVCPRKHSSEENNIDTVVRRWNWERANHGTKEQSEHHLPAHRLLNHSFKATQLKSGSFRVTVDGVPKALDILHKEKITCQLVKAVTKKDGGQVTGTSQKFQFAKN